VSAALATDAPVIQSITVAGIDLAAVTAVGSRLDVEVHVHSCAPIDRVEIASAANNKLLGTVTPRPQHGCDHVIRVPLAVTSGAVVATVFDRFGRAGTMTFALPPIADLAVTCGLDPHADDSTVALAKPAEIVLVRPGATVIASSVVVDGEPVAAFAMTRADGTRGALLAARDVPGPARDGVPVELAVTAVASCNGLVVATTTLVAVTVDAVAPRLRVHRFANAGEPLRVESDAAIETIEEAGSTIVRATDAAGNVTQREVVPVWFPHARERCPQ
jgi:hypothetical protein